MSEEPPHFTPTSGAGAIATAHEALAPGEESGEIVAVAGRLMRSRPQGRLAFGELRDWTGAVQLFALEDLTPDFAGFCALSLGDWIGAEGEVVRTRRGEISVKVRSWVLLAQAKRGFGDKWRGVSDPEIRYRQREVDLWANDGVRERFLLRSRIVSSIRRRLEADGYVEVETPVLQQIPGGANARPFLTHYNALDIDVYLRIAPELFLKRCVVGGFERVFELGRVFRNEGLSTRHNPEFTMLEAYRAYADYLDMSRLVEELVSGVAGELLGTTAIDLGGRRIDLAPPWRRATLNELIAEATGEELELSMGRTELARRAERLGVRPESSWGPGKIVAEVYEHRVEHELFEPTHVMDYPEEVSPLVRRHPTRPGYTERCTPVVGGREIAECYSELVDPDEQRSRLVEQAKARRDGDEEAMRLDEDFLRALEHGMPPTGGIGIGIDRLVMLLSGVQTIRDAILFPLLRPEASAS